MSSIIIDEVFNKTVPKPTSLRPGYDIEYIKKHYRYSGPEFVKMLNVEKLYDYLSIIRLRETPQQWAVRVRDTVQSLLAEKCCSIYHVYCLYAGFGEECKMRNDRYYRPRIHKGQMAICFDCWKLVKITDVKPKKTYFTRWRRYGYEIESKDLMKLHWDNECSKARTENGSARLIQRAYRNYRKRPVSLAKQVWETVRNDNTSREKKFLDMPSKSVRCTVNLDIWYYIDGGYRPYHVPDDQFYDYISYSKHKRHQLSDRLAIAKNTAQKHALLNFQSNMPINFSKTSLGDLAEVYFDSVRKNARR